MPVCLSSPHCAVCSCVAAGHVIARLLAVDEQVIARCSLVTHINMGQQLGKAHDAIVAYVQGRTVTVCLDMTLILYPNTVFSLCVRHCPSTCPRCLGCLMLLEAIQLMSV